MGLRVMVIALLACFVSTILLAEITNVGAEVVKVSTTPIFRKIPQGKMNKEFQVVVRVEATPVASEKGFAPIDLVVVLDPTSSMALAPVEKKPSRLEVLRTAMKFVVRELGENDRLAIVSSNDCSVDEEYNTGFLDISGDGRRNAIERLDRLEARGGGGAFLLGLETAVKMLDGRAAGSRKRAGFIIVLTDGGEDRSRTNVHASLGRYPVHAVGLSAAHDARALSSIAQESHGTYSFVDEMNLESIAGALAVCIGGLKTVVAVDMRVTLAAADERGRVQIKRIDSGGYESHISEHKASGSIAVGALYACEVKNFVVHLQVPAAGNHHLLTVGHSYSHAPGLPAAEGHHRVLVQRLGVDDDDAQQAPSALVLQQMVQFELLDMVASEAAGNFKQTHVSLGSVLQSRWDEFRRAHQFWAGVELSSMEKEVDALVSSLEGSSGVAYVLSWVSSHRMQRATSMGSPENVAAELLTPAMKLMLEEAHRRLPAAHEDKDRGCLDFLAVGRRLRVWSKARHDLQQLMFETSSEADLTAVFQEASLGAIDRAAHHDIYLAVVHATSQKRCGYAHA